MNTGAYGYVGMAALLLLEGLTPVCLRGAEKTAERPALKNPHLYLTTVQRNPYTNRKHTIQGPFGTLELVPMYIQPPVDYLRDNVDYFHKASDTTRWRFPGQDLKAVKTQLRKFGCPEPFLDGLESHQNPDPQIDGTDIRLPFPVYRSLDKMVRLQIIRHLSALGGRDPDYGRQVFLEGNFDTWTRNSRLSPATLDLLREFIYEHEDVVYFYDSQTIYNALPTEQERLYFLQLTFRYAALNVHLLIGSVTDENREQLIDYWGTNERRKRIEQIFDAALGNATLERIDILQFLPPFARARLNFYLDDYARDTMGRFSRDCKWSTLNFFNDIPDERFGTEEEGPGLMTAAFDEIPRPEKFGDIILMLDKAGTIVHACVHIAGPVVFTKNGRTDLTPFVFAYRDDVESIYRVEGVTRHAYLRARYARPTQSLRRGVSGALP